MWDTVVRHHHCTHSIIPASTRLRPNSIATSMALCVWLQCCVLYKILPSQHPHHHRPIISKTPIIFSTTCSNTTQNAGFSQVYHDGSPSCVHTSNHCQAYSTPLQPMHCWDPHLPPPAPPVVVSGLGPKVMAGVEKCVEKCFEEWYVWRAYQEGYESRSMKMVGVCLGIHVSYMCYYTCVSNSSVHCQPLFPPAGKRNPL